MAWPFLRLGDGATLPCSGRLRHLVGHGFGALALILALDRHRLILLQHQPAAERAFAILEVHPVGLAGFDHLTGLVDGDLAALGRLPDHESTARILAALP